MKFLNLCLLIFIFACKTDSISMYKAADLKFKSNELCEKKYKTHLVNTCKEGVANIVILSSKLLNKESTYDQAYAEAIGKCLYYRFDVSEEACKYGVNKFIELAMNELGKNGLKEIEKLNLNLGFIDTGSVNDQSREIINTSFDNDYEFEEVGQSLHY